MWERRWYTGRQLIDRRAINQIKKTECIVRIMSGNVWILAVQAKRIAWCLDRSPYNLRERPWNRWFWRGFNDLKCGKGFRKRARWHQKLLEEFLLAVSFEQHDQMHWSQALGQAQLRVDEEMCFERCRWGGRGAACSYSSSNVRFSSVAIAMDASYNEQWMVIIEIRMKRSRTPPWLPVSDSDALLGAAMCLFLWSLRWYFSKASSTVLALLSAIRNTSHFIWCRQRPRSLLKELPHPSHAKTMINKPENISIFSKALPSA